MNRLSVVNFVSLVLLFTLAHCSKTGDIKLTGSGTLEAIEVLVQSKTVGDVVEMNVNEGDHVQFGDVIARIDTEKVMLNKLQLLAGLEELDLNLKNARRAIRLANDQYENAAKKYDRVKALFEQQSATEQQLDDVEMAQKAATTQFEIAQTSLQALQAKRKQINAQHQLLNSKIRDATIRAPISGLVIVKYVEKGEMVSAGSPVINLADLTKLWIRVYFATNDVGKIKIGSSAQLKMDAFPDKSYSGKVTWISPKAEFTPKIVQTKKARADLVYAVKLEVDNLNGELKIGMPADVWFE